MGERTFRCEIYSPEGTVYSGETTKVVATAIDGELGVLFNHAPLVTALGEGSLRITAVGGEELRYVAHGGFLEVFKNHVTILTEKVEKAE
ncbi:MAG: ATP synthase F1 subunit epsilon [Candidatus Eisenbacteria bacterium]